MFGSETKTVFWDFEKFPDEVRHDRKICLVKDSAKSEDDTGNYRPIFLQNIPFFKVPDRILITRLQKMIGRVLEPEQGGFIAKRGTAEQS